MLDNPYTTANSATQITAETSVLVDASGNLLPVGGKIDEVTIDPSTGERRQRTTHLVVLTADGVALLFPFDQPLYTCNVCGARPLLRAMRCKECGKHACTTCTAPDEPIREVRGERLGICKKCKPLWQRLIDWLLNRKRTRT